MALKAVVAIIFWFVLMCTATALTPFWFGFAAFMLGGLTTVILLGLAIRWSIDELVDNMGELSDIEKL